MGTGMSVHPPSLPELLGVLAVGTFAAGIHTRHPMRDVLLRREWSLQLSSFFPVLAKKPKTEQAVQTCSSLSKSFGS